MNKRQQALAQLSLLRHADNLTVRSAAETGLWLDQHCDTVKDIDHPLCQVCSRTLQDLIENSYENF